MATEYAIDTNAWLVGLPKLVTTTKTDPDPESGSLSRRIGFTYKGTTGLLDKETVEEGDAALQVTTEHIRTGNAFGLVSETKQTWLDPRSGIAKSRSVKTSYDTHGRFPQTVSRQANEAPARDLSESTTYVAATGAGSSMTGPNGLTTQWATDGFGRVRKEVRADGNETRIALKRCAGGGCVEASGATLVQITQQYRGAEQIAVPQLAFSDNAGHVLRTHSYGFDGKVTYVEQRYDTLGRLSYTSQPAVDGESAFMASSTTYDVLNRPVLQEMAGGQKLTMLYSGFDTTVTNVKAHQRTEFRNVIGQLLKVVDAAAGVTQFAYEPFGGLRKTIDPRTNVIKIEYDKLGRKKALVDPDLGRIEYAPDPLGRVLNQSSPVQRGKSSRTEFTYDLLDRMTARTEEDLRAEWEFDTAAHGKGQLAKTWTWMGSNKDYQRSHEFDGFGRPLKTTQVLTDATYTSSVDYDGWGPVITQTHQRGTAGAAKAFQQRYNNKGYLARIERGGLVLWEAKVQDAANRLRETLLGNGLKQVTTFDGSSGHVMADQVKTGSAAARVDLGYTYDTLGNVDMRIQYLDGQGFIELFTYDNLNRLQSSQVTDQPKFSYTYFADGTMKSKTGVGSGDYEYPAAGPAAVRPHAVLNIPIVASFSYDSNGNLISAGTKTVGWTSFDMPKSISKGASTSTFRYGSELQRTRQDRNDGMSTVYAGAQEVESTGTKVVVKTYWPNGLGLEIDTTESGVVKPTQLLWVLLDRLGSVIALTRADGTHEERLAYDAWGKRSRITGDGTPDELDGQVNNRGFTGHEMLDQLDLVHMNGRVYDPLVGMFMSGDPLIQDAMNGQNYARYSYVLNNPTNFTDPTGFACADGSDKSACHGMSTSTSMTSDNSTPASKQWAAEDKKKQESVNVARDNNNSDRNNGKNQAPASTGGNGSANSGFLGWLKKVYASGGGGAAPEHQLGGQYEVNQMGDPVNPNYPGVGAAQVVGGGVLVAGVAVVAPEIIPIIRIVGRKELREGEDAWSVPQAARDKFPESWGAGTPNSKGVGQRWQDPKNQGNGVRVDQGNPLNSQPAQKVGSMPFPVEFDLGYHVG